ncbi:hypothetical protein C0995_008359 [Termitomyces sp. Mi166|nr:hypothetical protein C0995_008359 [Termitomyces sp. Mi166\
MGRHKKQFYNLKQFKRKHCNSDGSEKENNMSSKIIKHMKDQEKNDRSPQSITSNPYSIDTTHYNGTSRPLEALNDNIDPTTKKATENPADILDPADILPPALDMPLVEENQPPEDVGTLENDENYTNSSQQDNSVLLQDSALLTPIKMTATNAIPTATPPWWNDPMPDLIPVLNDDDNDYCEEDDFEDLPHCDPKTPSKTSSSTLDVPIDLAHIFMRVDYTMDDEDYYFFNESEDDKCYILFYEILDSEDEDDLDDSISEEKKFNSKKGVFIFPPSMEEAELAFKDLTKILKPPQAKGHGYKDSKLDDAITIKLEGVRLFLVAYVQMEKKEPGE